MLETVVKRENFTEIQQAVLHNGGPETEIGYWLAWARTCLKTMGPLDNSVRGVWSLTDDGVTLLAEVGAMDQQGRGRIRQLWMAHMAELRKARKAKPSTDEPQEHPEEMSEEISWNEKLLNQLMAM